MRAKRFLCHVTQPCPRVHGGGRHGRLGVLVNRQLSRLLLGLVLLSLPGLALTVTDRMLTEAVNTSACYVPAPATTFLTTDQAVWLWFSVTGANIDDLPSATWYLPDGTIYRPVNWIPVQSAGAWCFWAHIDIAGQPASSPGNWSIQVAWNGSPLFTLPFSIVASAVPSINTGGITNAASSSQGPFAAGSHLTIKGANLAHATTGVTTAPLPTSLNGAQVSVGGFTAHLLYVSPTQINLQVPWELSGQTQTSVSVQVDLTGSAPQTMSLAPYGPGIYAMNGSGTGQGAIQIANTTLFAAPAGMFPGSRPVQPGEYISIYATGLGAVTNQPASGAFALADPLSWTSAIPTVTLGGVPAQVTFSGLGPAPGNPGLYQVNAQIPANAPSGDAVPLSLSIGNAVSNTVMIAVAGTATLNVTKTGTGTGTVTSSPAGISCGATCSASYASGAQVTLTAAADPGSSFAGWSGGGCSGSGTCTVAMSGSQAVTATFIPVSSQFTLTVTYLGTAGGSVTVSPGGTVCGPSCWTYAAGTVVTLTATPNSQTTFAGWSGAGCSGTGTCTVTMNANQTVTVTFNPISGGQFLLTVAKTGTGSGTVTSSPAGINCGSACSASYASGAQVTLTAAADPASAFAGWSGACSGTGTCAVTMNAAATVTASFNTAGQGGIAISSLSGNSVPPFGTLVINGSGFDPANAAISVLLTPTAGGPSIAVPAAAATANSIQICVPPLLGATQGIATGAASVQVIQLEGTTLSTSNVVTGLQITALPAVPADAVPGEVTLGVLDETLNVDATTIAAAQRDPDLADLAAALVGFNADLNTLVSAIQAIKNDPSKTITITGANGVPITLDANTLALSDQLMWAYLSEFLAEMGDLLQPSPAAGRSAAAEGMFPAPADNAAVCAGYENTDPVTQIAACGGQQDLQNQLTAFDWIGTQGQKVQKFLIGMELSPVAGWAAAASGMTGAEALVFGLLADFDIGQISAVLTGTERPSLYDSVKDASIKLLDEYALGGHGILPASVDILSFVIPIASKLLPTSPSSAPQKGLILTGPQTGVPKGSSGVQAFQTSNGKTTVTTLAAPASQQVNPISSVTIPPPASCTLDQLNAWNNICMAIYNSQAADCNNLPTLLGQLGCINAAVGAWEQCFDACQP